MRIWHQSMAPLDEDAYSAYRDALDRHIADIVSPGTTVDLHGVAPGSYLGRAPTAVLQYPYAKHIIHSQALGACLQAEREGYDAVAFASFGDPFLTECRSLVDIPVVSMVESSLLVGCSLAQRMGLVALTPRSLPRVAELVRRHGLESRVELVALEPKTTETELLAILNGGNDDALMAGLATAARHADAGGADLLVPAEGVFNEVLHLHEVRSVGRAAVMDTIGVLFAYAELQVRLHQTCGLSAARSWSYPKPDAALLDELIRSQGDRS